MTSPNRNVDSMEITTAANNIPLENLDCGIRMLGWCRGTKCLNWARIRVFAACLACASVLQGIAETYFRLMAKETAAANGFNPILVDWLLVSGGILQAVLALAYAYWAQRLHPISWLSGTIILQSMTYIISMIPNMMEFSQQPASVFMAVTDTEMCRSSLQTHLPAVGITQSSEVLLVMIFLMQFATAIAALALYTVGLIYIDENATSCDSLMVISIVFAAKIMGLHLGALFNMGIEISKVGWWLGWIILAVVICIFGILLGLFPRRLPETAVHQAAQRILEQTGGTPAARNKFFSFAPDTAFGPTIRRLFCNKLFISLVGGWMFMEAAIVNYSLQEEQYLQSRFLLPFDEMDGLTQEWRARLLMLFFKQPVSALSIIIGGLLISKMKLNGRLIAGMNVGLSCVLLVMHIALIFVKCDVGPVAGTRGGKLQQPYCSRQCICGPTAFAPVCPDNSSVTYFSPCYAGCTQKSFIGNIQTYSGCTCGGSDTNEPSTTREYKASEGSCRQSKCYASMIVYQGLSVIIAAAWGKLIIGKFTIMLRSVWLQDRALALALQVTLVGLFTYVVMYLVYGAISKHTCLYWSSGYASCLLHQTPKHGNLLLIVSACLIGVSVIFDIFVFVFTKDLNLYNCKITDPNFTPNVYAPIPASEPILLGAIADNSIPTSSTTTNPSSISTSETTTTTTLTKSIIPSNSTTNDSQLLPGAGQTSTAKVVRQASSAASSSLSGASSSIDTPVIGITHAQITKPLHEPQTSTEESDRSPALRKPLPSQSNKRVNGTRKSETDSQSDTLTFRSLSPETNF